jgi:hypothetical protein
VAGTETVQRLEAGEANVRSIHLLNRFSGGGSSMKMESEDRTCVPSTTFAWRKVKMKPPPAGHDTARAKRGRWHHLPRWPRTRDLTIKVAYRGGPESWWLVTARGSTGVFPGHLALEDVMVDVLNEARYGNDGQDEWDSHQARRRRAAGHRNGSRPDA